MYNNYLGIYCIVSVLDFDYISVAVADKRYSLLTTQVRHLSTISFCIVTNIILLKIHKLMHKLKKKMYIAFAHTFGRPFALFVCLYIWQCTGRQI